MTESTGTPDGENVDESAPPAEEPEFQNRASRRSRGKGDSSQQRLDGQKGHVDTHGSFHSPKQYGRRRSG